MLATPKLNRRITFSLKRKSKQKETRRINPVDNQKLLRLRLVIC